MVYGLRKHQLMRVAERTVADTVPGEDVRDEATMLDMPGYMLGDMPDMPIDGIDEAEPADPHYEEPDANIKTTPEVIDQLYRWSDPEQTMNIAEEIDPAKHGEIAMKVIRETEIDEESRQEWLEQARAAVKMALQAREEKSYPWPGAASVCIPLMTEAADQFASRAYPAIVAGPKVVKGIVNGEDKGVPAIDPATGQQAVDPATGKPAWAKDQKTGKEMGPGYKQEMADDISEHMSAQLLEEMPEWEEETDKLLHLLPLAGCMFRKTYFDPTEGRNMSVMVSFEDLIIDYKAKSMATAPRLTERLKFYPYEIEEAKRAGHFLDVDYGWPEEPSQDEDAPIEFYEQHRRLDLDDDGYPEPYIVTVAVASQTLARIVARYDRDGVKLAPHEDTLVKIVPVHYYTKYDFLPNKEGGIYGQGFGQTLMPINAAANTTLNQLIDAGHLANLRGGFIGKSLSLKAGNLRVMPGEWKTVNAAGAAIRDAIVPVDYKEPSSVLFQLLGLLIDFGKNISSVKDVLTGELKAQTMSPTVFLALVEQGLKVYVAIYKRIYRSLKAEYNKLFRLNRIFLDEQFSYQANNQWKEITRAHYDSDSGVVPVSDPNMVADAQRMAKGQFLVQVGAKNPMFNQEEVWRRVLDAANIDGIDKLIVKDQPPDPEIIAKAAELEIKAVAARANAIAQLTVAVKNLADADATHAATIRDDFMAWASTNLQAMQVQLDALGQSPQGAPGQPPDPAGGGGPGPGELPGMAQPPMQPGSPPVPPGFPGENPAGPSGSVGVGPAA